MRNSHMQIIYSSTHRRSAKSCVLAKHQRHRSGYSFCRSGGLGVQKRRHLSTPPFMLLVGQNPPIWPQVAMPGLP